MGPASHKPHPATAAPRSETWNPQGWNPTAVPSVAQIARAIRPDCSQAQLDQYYSDDNLRKALY